MDMESIDIRIIGACNELMDLKMGTTKLKVENKNERARLKRELDQRKLELDNRLRSLRSTKDLSAYRQACDQVFDEAGIKVPGLAAARQAQLCLHVHIMTVMENQLDLAKEQYDKELSYLETELNKVRETIMESEVSCLNEIVRLNQENREFREWMDKPIYIKKKKVPPPEPPQLDSKGRPRVRFAEALEDKDTAPDRPSKIIERPVNKAMKAPTVNKAMTAPTVNKAMTAPTVNKAMTAPTVERQNSLTKMTVPSRPEFLVLSS